MLKCEQTILAVIDIQDALLPKDEAVAANYLDRAVKLIQAAQTLGIPILVTEQNPDRLGATNARVAGALSQEPRLPKMAFGCMGDVGFVSALEASGRRQLLITGMEAHVCVMQTVLAAMDAGYEAFVVRDAVVSTSKPEYKAGLARMAQAGASLVTSQMAIFELLGAAGTPKFRQVLPLLK